MNRRHEEFRKQTDYISIVFIHTERAHAGALVLVSLQLLSAGAKKSILGLFSLLRGLAEWEDSSALQDESASSAAAIRCQSRRFDLGNWIPNQLFTSSLNLGYTATPYARYASSPATPIGGRRERGCKHFCEREGIFFRSARR